MEALPHDDQGWLHAASWFCLGLVSIGLVAAVLASVPISCDLNVSADRDAEASVGARTKPDGI